MVQKMNGTWFEFQHHNTKEGIYWNPQCLKFSSEQWREKIQEIKEMGMEYIVLLATALDFHAYYDTDIFPKFKMACENPIETLLLEADKCDMKVFISAGFYGDWANPQVNMTDPKVTKAGLNAMNQIAELYGNHNSLHGWYFPDETCINGYFSDDFINYVNLYSKEAKILNKNYKNLIAPYGTCLVKTDDKYISQLEKLDVDFVAYQDEIGVQKTKVEESARLYENLKIVHDKASRAALWADIELFEFEGNVYESPLLPADFSRVKKQLEAVSPYVENVLVYQYQGMMNKPNSTAFAGHESSTKLYCDYMNWLKNNYK